MKPRARHAMERHPAMPPVATDDSASTRRSRLALVYGGMTSRVRVLMFAAVLVMLGSTILLITPGVATMPDRDWTMPFFALVIAFGLAEATALHVEIRKESHSLSLSGIPLMFGLLFVSPIMLTAAYVLGAAPAMLWIRKSDWVKALWNSCLFVAESALAAFIVRTALGEALPRTAIEWLVPLGAVLLAELVSLLAVPLVIMAVDAKFRPHLFADVGRSQILAALAGTFTVTVVAASTSSPYMTFYAIVPIIGVGALLQNTGQLSQRHKDLQQLHTFTRSLANERGLRTLDTGLHELAQIMRTRMAGLLVVGHGADERSTLRILRDDSFEDLPAEPYSNLLVDHLEGGAVTELTLDDERPAVKALLQRLGVRKLVAIQILGELDHAGVLFVADRLGMRSDFHVDELRLFGSLANTLSARLSNDHLVERLEVQARSDSLTGLPNRLNFEVAVTASLGKPERSGVVVMVDLDRFKEINDSLGHETGDRLLIEIARRLQSAARPSDMVSRFGGDEFAMLLVHNEADTAGDFALRVNDIHELLTSKVELDGITFEVGASLGVAQWPVQGKDSASLLHRADTAMYEAKRNQLGVVWYTPELDADAPRRLDLYLSAGSALDRDDLYVHFQPKVSATDGHITGAEALVRWTHPAHGPVSPAEFVPLMVQAGLIGKMTRFVVRRAAEAAAMFRDAGHDIPVAINFTPRDLLDAELVDDIAAILAEIDLRADALLVEITEDSMVVDFDTSIRTLERLRALGVRVAIDDFGTGYSSMQHLHRLPLDQLKIDRSFVSRMADDESAAAIVRASINLAKELGLTTVAEGVQDEQTFQQMRALGCREIQGFLVGRPVPAHVLLKWARGWQPGPLLDLVARRGPIGGIGEPHDAIGRLLHEPELGAPVDRRAAAFHRAARP